MLKQELNLKKLINQSRFLSVIDREIQFEIRGDDFPGGYDNNGGFGGGTGGGGSGTTSSNIVPSLSISPSDNQSVVIGNTVCFQASGVTAFAQEAEQTANLLGGCSKTSSGTWVKTCGVNGSAGESAAFDTNLIYKQRSFQFTGKNSSLNSAALPYVHVVLFLGAKTTNGYMFYWELSKSCNNINKDCSKRWIGSGRMTAPDGVQTVFFTGYVEFNQSFRIRSTGQDIFWDHTTENKWANGKYGIPIPADSGDFQLFTDGLYYNNTWGNLTSSKGSYQANPNAEDFIWTSDCSENIVITGTKACYTPVTPSHCKICVSTINSNPQCVSVISAPLTLTPVGIDCKSCSDENINCVNIPIPTTPVISLSSNASNSISINWEDSLSFTNGLYYNIKVNNIIQNTLDSSVTLNSLALGNYTISVQAVDACGQSAWSSSKSITLS